MAKPNWPHHLCDKIPDSKNTWRLVAIIKAPYQTHRYTIYKKAGEFYGEVSWKRFDYVWNFIGEFWLPNHDGQPLNPPICPFCDASLIEEEEKL